MWSLREITVFLHFLQQKQTLLTFPALLALPWNKPRRNLAVFQHCLFIGLPCIELYRQDLALS